MDLSTLLGVIIGIVSLVLSIIIEFNHLNPDLGSEFLKISSLLMIFGGTFGATMISFPMNVVKNLPNLCRIGFSNAEFDAPKFIDKMENFAILSRKEGILRLEQEIPEIEKENKFLATGLRLVVDGTDSEVLSEMLDSQIEAMEERHKEGVELFNSLGGYAPTMGIIGTVVGLIAALAKAGEGGGEGGGSEVVAAIATAFIATFYGIGAANLLFLPIGSKLKAKSQHETFLKNLICEAIKSIQKGDNPTTLRNKLIMFLK